MPSPDPAAAGVLVGVPEGFGGDSGAQGAPPHEEAALSPSATASGCSWMVMVTASQFAAVLITTRRYSYDSLFDTGELVMGNYGTDINDIGDIYIKTNLGCTLVLKDVRERLQHGVMTYATETHEQEGVVSSFQEKSLARPQSDIWRTTGQGSPYSASQWTGLRFAPYLCWKLLCSCGFWAKTIGISRSHQSH